MTATTPTLESRLNRLSERRDPFYPVLMQARQIHPDLHLNFPELLLCPDRPLRLYNSASLEPTHSLFSELNRLITLFDDGDEVRTAYSSYIQGVCSASGKSRWKLLKGEVRLIAQLSSRTVCLFIPKKLGREIASGSSSEALFKRVDHRPLAPAVQEATQLLAAHLFNREPSTFLLVELYNIVSKDGERTTRAFQFSPPVEGKPLWELLSQSSDSGWLSPASFSHSFFMDLLCLPRRANSDCFRVDESGSIQAIDYSEGFAPPIEGLSVRCKSIHFLLDPLMQLPIDPSYRDHLLAIDVEVLVVNWAAALNKNPSHLFVPINLSPSNLSYLAITLKETQRLLSSSREMTHWALLNHFHPTLCAVYQALVQRYPGKPLEAEELLFQEDLRLDSPELALEASLIQGSTPLPDDRIPPIAALEVWLDSILGVVEPERGRDLVTHFLRLSKKSAPTLFKKSLLYPRLNLARAIPIGATQLSSPELIQSVVESGTPEALQLLFELGLSPEVRVEDGSLLHLMAKANRSDLIACEQWNLEIRAPIGRTPLHLAVLHHSLNAVKTLLDLGASPFSVDDDLETPLHLAIYPKANLELIELILDPLSPQERSALLSMGNRDGKQPIHLAVWQKDPRIVELLIQAGSDPNAMNNFGYTPLHWTAKHRLVESARLLLQAGAEAAVANQNQETPISLSLDYGFDEVARLFISTCFSDQPSFVELILTTEKRCQAELRGGNYSQASATLATLFPLVINTPYQKWLELHLHRIEGLFLREQGQAVLPPYTGQIDHYRKRLKEIRMEAKENKSLEEAQKLIAKGYQEVALDLFQESLSSLGSPSHKHAFVALDPLSREEGLPSSKALNFAILVEKSQSVSLFEVVAKLLEIKIANLGESHEGSFALHSSITVGTPEKVAYLLPASLHYSHLVGSQTVSTQYQGIKEQRLKKNKGYQTQGLTQLNTFLTQWQKIQARRAVDKRALRLEQELYQPLELAIRSLLLYFRKDKLSIVKGVRELPLSVQSQQALQRALHHAAALNLQLQMGEEVEIKGGDKATLYQFLTELHGLIATFVTETRSSFFTDPRAHLLSQAHLTFALPVDQPIHIAAREGNRGRIQELLDRESRIDSLDPEGYTPLHLAVLHHQTEAAAFLLERMDHIPLSEGLVSPLHLAAAEGSSEMANLLLSHYSPQALIELKDRNGETALHWAARKGHLELVQLLLERGSSRKTKNQKGENPFEIALKKGQYGIAQLILFYPSSIPEDLSRKELFSLVKLAHDCLKGKRSDSWLPEYYEKPNFWVAALLLNIACLNAKKVSSLCEDFLLHQLEQLESSFVQHELGKGIPYTSRIRDDRNRIKEIRERVSQSLEQKFPVPIDTVLLELTQDYKELLADLLNECIAVKGEAPPSRFAMVGLGSMSRNEMCPYSDVEFIFLIQEDNEEIRSYFRSIARLISLKIVNLGETNYPLPGGYSGNIESTPSGFKMDSALSPLGQRGLYEESGDELIGTPQRLADFQVDESKVIIIRNALSTSCLIAGEPALLRTYQEQIRLHLASKAPGLEQTRGERMALELIKDDVIEFAPRLTQEKIDGRAFGIKQELYRLPQSLINALCLYHGVRGASAFQRIDRLRDQGVFSITGANQLKRVFRSALKMRTRAHFFYRKEEEVLYHSRGDEDLEGAGLLTITPQINQEIIEVYRVLIPLHQRAQKFLNGDWNAFAKRSFCDATIGNYDDSFRETLQYETAIKSATTALATNPNNSGSRAEMGRVQLDIGEARRAAKNFEEALHLLKREHGDQPHPDVASSLNDLGNAYHDLGEYQRAIEYHEQSLAMKRQIFGDKPEPTIANSLNNLGNVYDSLGEYRHAIEQHKQSLAMLKRIHSDRPHPSVAAGLNNLGIAYRNLGEYRRAIEYFEQSLVMKKQIYGDRPHPDVVSSLIGLGNAYNGLSEYRRAIEYHEQSLAMLKQIHSDRPHSSIANSLMGLGNAYNGLSEYRRAIEYHEQSLAMLKQIHDDNSHPHVAANLNNLRNAYENLGEYRRAIEYGEQSLAMFKQIHHSTTHPDVANSLVSLGNAYSRLGDYQRAIECYDASLTMFKQIHSDLPHPDIANRLSNLGNAYDNWGEYQRAIEYGNLSLAMFKQIHGNRPHPDVAGSLGNLGKVYHSLGEYRYAIERLEQSLAMTKQIHGDQPHLDIANSLMNLGKAYNSLGEYAHVIECYDASLTMFKQIHRDLPHPDIASSLMSLGDVYRGLGKYRGALEYYEQSSTMFKQIHGDLPHLDIASSLMGLGNVYHRLSEYRQAVECHEASLTMLKQIYGALPHLGVASSLGNLGNLYHSLGEYRYAIKRHEVSLTMLKQIYKDQPHPDVAASLNNLGMAYSSLSEYRQAIEYHEASLAMKKQLHSDQPHPDVAISLHNLGNAYFKLSKYPQAIEYHTAALTMKVQIHKDCPHPTVAASLMSLGHDYCIIGKYREAIKLYNASLVMYRQVHSDQPHADIAANLMNLGCAYKSLGEYQQVVEHFQNAYEMFIQIVGAKHPNTKKAKQNLDSARSNLALKITEESKGASSTSSSST